MLVERAKEDDDRKDLSRPIIPIHCPGGQGKRGLYWGGDREGQNPLKL